MIKEERYPYITEYIRLEKIKSAEMSDYKKKYHDKLIEETELLLEIAFFRSETLKGSRKIHMGDGE